MTCFFWPADVLVCVEQAGLEQSVTILVASKSSQIINQIANCVDSFRQYFKFLRFHQVSTIFFSEIFEYFKIGWLFFSRLDSFDSTTIIFYFFSNTFLQPRAHSYGNNVNTPKWCNQIGKSPITFIDFSRSFTSFSHIKRDWRDFSAKFRQSLYVCFFYTN